MKYKNLLVLILMVTVIFLSINVKRGDNSGLNSVKKKTITNNKLDKIFIKNISLQCFNNEYVELLNLFGTEEELLIFRFTGSNCDLCYISVLKILEKYYQTDRIIAISTFKSRTFKIFLNELNTKVKIYNTIENVFNETLDGEHSPYFCTLNKQLEVSNFFIPKKNSPNETDKYIKDFLQNKNVVK